MATIKLYINTDRGDISRAFVKSTSEPTTESNVPALVAGNKRNVEVYLIDSAGNYDARSGAGNYALSIGAGPLAGTPSSGTFTLTDGTETTTALAHNASAQVVEDALNALNSSAGPFSQLVDVTSTYDGNYLVKFRTTGAVAALAGDASELSPQSAVVVDEARAGDGSTKEQQFIRLLRQPAIFQDSFTQIANGWSGELSANNSRVLELMAGRDTIAIPLDVELTETGNEPETIARGNMLLSNEVINGASIDPGNLAQLLTEALGDARYLRKSNNLSDVTNAATARSNIGAAAAADLTAHTGSTSNPHSVTAAQVGLGNVDNTSDASKPVSTAQQAALDLKADATALTTETNARIDADNRREFAGGVYLDGTSGLTESIITILDESNNFTLNEKILVFNFNLTGSNNVSNEGVFSKRSANVGGYECALNAQGEIVFIAFKTGSNNVFLSNKTTIAGLNDGKTYKITIVADFTNPSNAEIVFYVNGVLSGTTVTTAPNGTYGDASLNTNLSLGYTVGFGKLTGSVSNLAIFNTALTATQASELYQQGLQPWLAANPEYRRGFSDPTYQSDFSSGTDSWSQNIGSPSITFSSVSSELNATATANTNFQLTRSNTIEYGQLYSITFEAFVESGSGLAYWGMGAFDNKENIGNSILITEGVWQSVTLSFSRSSAGSSIRLASFTTINGDTSDTILNGKTVKLRNIEVTQLGSLATLPLNDDCRQLKDISGNRNDATASESGVTHLKQKDLHLFRDDNADGTGGSYLIANADILAENEVITGVTVDGRFYAASGAQDLTKRRIKLQDHGSHVDVKRSNGTTDDSAIAVTNPNDGTNFAITVLTQRI